MRPKENDRSWLWRQGLLLLLPVILLAAAGGFLLWRDVRLAQAEVRSQMQFLAENLAATIPAGLRHECMMLSNANYEWYTENRMTVGLTAWARGTDISKAADEVKTRRSLFRQRYPDADFSALPRCQWLSMATNGFPLDPRPEETIPSPPEWLANLTPIQRQSWHRLTQDLADTEPAAVSNAFQRFLEFQPPPGARANAEYLWLLHQTRGLTPLEAIGRWTTFAGQQSEDVLTESGLSVAHLAYLEVMHRCSRPDDVPDTLLKAIGMRLLIRPSLLETPLMRELDRLAKLGNAPWNARYQALRVVCSMDAKTRLVLKAFAEQHPASAWTQTMHWVKSPLGEFLLTRLLEGNEFTVRLYPREYIHDALQYTLRSAQLRLPDYAGVRVELANRTIDLAARNAVAALAPTPPVLGTSMVQPTSMGLTDPVKLTIYLADPSRLYATQKLRLVGFALFIATAALVAIVGLLHARRVFLRQMEISEMRANFVSSVSHELRAPIASIRLMAESLGRGHIRDESRRLEYCRLMVQECSRLGTLIGNVLDFARIDQGRSQFEFEPTDLPALVRQTVAALEPYAANKRVHLVVNADATAFNRLEHDVFLDGRAVQQALVNLIDNAIKHSPPDAAVTIGLEVLAGNTPNVGSAPTSKISPSDAPKLNPRIELSVADQGPGIPREDHERIFQPFYRRGSELRRETAGIGIGLSIVKHILEAHGGRVRVQSQPGQGSQFVMEFPWSVSLSSGHEPMNPGHPNLPKD
jgi:signal transduction histidine kinase